jgi:hypothetical protein
MASTVLVLRVAGRSWRGDCGSHYRGVLRLVRDDILQVEGVAMGRWVISAAAVLRGNEPQREADNAPRHVGEMDALPWIREVARRREDVSEA